MNLQELLTTIKLRLLWCSSQSSTVSLFNITWCCLFSRGVNFPINLPFHANLHPVRACSDPFDPLTGPSESLRHCCLYRHFSRLPMRSITFTGVKVKWLGTILLTHPLQTYISFEYAVRAAPKTIRLGQKYFPPPTIDSFFPYQGFPLTLTVPKSLLSVSLTFSQPFIRKQTNYIQNSRLAKQLWHLLKKKKKIALLHITLTS